MNSTSPTKTTSTPISGTKSCIACPVPTLRVSIPPSRASEARPCSRHNGYVSRTKANAKTKPGALRAMRTLRAVRRFSDREIPADALDAILEVGRWTGSAKNTQPWSVVLVTERETLAALSQLGQFAGHIAGAKCALVLVMDSANNAFDCGRLAERLMVAAWAHGVGSCIGSLFPDENASTAKRLLGVPEEKWVRHILSLGYPADETAHRISSTPGTRSVLPSVGRKPMRDFVSRERYGA
jgi:nitroreductase